MKFIQALTYFSCVLFLYLLLFLIEFISALWIKSYYLIHDPLKLYLFIFLLLVINPLLTYLIVDKMPFSRFSLAKKENKEQNHE